MAHAPTREEHRKLPEPILEVMYRLCVQCPLDGALLRNGFREILQLPASPVRDALLGSVLTGVLARGASADEVLAMLRAVQDLDGLPGAPTQRLELDRRVVVVHGSGKKGVKTVNVSTPSCVLAAAAGACVAKVGSRGTSSLTGAYEFLATVGVNVDLDLDDGIRMLEETGFGYFNSEALAPNFFGCYKGLFHSPHALMFGFSPMLSPVQGDAVLYGIAHPDVGLSARVMCELGFRDVRIYSNTADGIHHIDEIGVFGTTFEARVEDGRVGPVAQIDVATTLGLDRYGADDIREAATAGRNVEASRRALVGIGAPAHEDLLCVNAGAILRLGGECETLADGYELARTALRAGRGAEKLEQIAAASRAGVTA